MDPGAQHAEGSGPPRRGFRGNDSNKNTRLCMRWANGDCRFGDRCNFAHGEQELRSLPPRAEGGYGRGVGGYGGAPRGGYGGRGYGGRGAGWDDGYGGGGYDAGAWGGGYATGYPAPQMAAPAGGRAPYGGQQAPPDDIYARQGFPVQGPNGWVAYKAQDSGEVYYHNHNTQVTQWDRPQEWPSGP